MDFEDEKSSNDIINNATMSDDEVVAFYGPRGPCFLTVQVFAFPKASRRS